MPTQCRESNKSPTEDASGWAAEETLKVPASTLSHHLHRLILSRSAKAPPFGPRAWADVIGCPYALSPHEMVSGG